MTATPALIDLFLGALHRDRARLDVERLAGLSPEETNALVELAIEQRVGALLYHRLAHHESCPEVPDVLRTRLQAYHRACAVRSLQLYAEFRTVAGVLQAEGIRVLALKGIHVAQTAYPDAALREMNDIDLLVPKSDLRRGDVALTAAGRVPYREASLEANVQESRHVRRVALDPNFGTEVHWSLTDPGHPYSVDSDELWARAVPVTLAGREVLGLPPEDLLLHLAHHASYQHHFAFGLRPSCDLDAVIEAHAGQIDWDTLVERARRWGWARGVAIAFRLATDLVGAAVPEPVLRGLVPEGVEEGLVVVAREQVLGSKAEGSEVPSNLAQKWVEGGVGGRLRGLWNQVFLPRVELCHVYGLPLDTPRLWPHYLARIADLARRRRRLLWRLVSGEKGMARRTEQRGRLVAYLEAPDPR